MSAAAWYASVAGAALCLVFRTAPAGAQSGAHYVELSAGYKAGDFGTDTDSRLYTLLPAWGYIAPRYDLGATVPVLRLRKDAAGASASETGLGDGGPDYGVTLGLVRWLGGRRAAQSAAMPPSTVVTRGWERP